VFKRLRDGLLGRAEPDQQEIVQTTVSPDADETVETAETDEALEALEANDADQTNEAMSFETPLAAQTSSASYLSGLATRSPDQEGNGGESLGDEFDDRGESDTG